MSYSSILGPELEEYTAFLNSAAGDKAHIVTKARIERNYDKWCETINTWLVYPDLLADIMTPKDSKFSFYFGQRIMSRVMNRHAEVFTTACRASAKSFVADYNAYINAMLTPRLQIAIGAATGQQAADIAKQKVIDDIWVKFPLLAGEMVKTHVAGRIKEPYIAGKDYCRFNFTNGSYLVVIGGHPRGMRFHQFIFEEVIEIEPVKVNEEWIPTMNIKRVDIRGQRNEYEMDSTQNYVTTAGYQGTFAYNKNLEILCKSVLDPDRAMVIGWGYETPVRSGLLTRETLKGVMSSPTFNRESFDREYGSKWSGSRTGAAFDATQIATSRRLKRFERTNKIDPEKDSESFYVVSADMAKDGAAQTDVVVLKITPKEYKFQYDLVNLFEIPYTNYEKVGNILKETALAYNARLLVYDANGIGASIRDWLNKPTNTEDGRLLPGLGIINPPSSAESELIRYPDYATICYEIKATGNLAGTIHQLYFARLSSNSIRMLIPTAQAVTMFSEFKNFKNYSQRKQMEFLEPYLKTDKLELQLKNLDKVSISDGVNATMKIKMRDASIQKDFFSALEYSVYAVTQKYEINYYNLKNRPKSKVVVLSAGF